VEYYLVNLLFLNISFSLSLGLCFDPNFSLFLTNWFILVGDNVNQVIDDNWQEFDKEMGPAFAQALSSVFKLILSNILGLVPFQNIFL
jgi:hypothetical protein